MSLAMDEHLARGHAEVPSSISTRKLDWKEWRNLGETHSSQLSVALQHNVQCQPTPKTPRVCMHIQFLKKSERSSGDESGEVDEPTDDFSRYQGHQSSEYVSRELRYALILCL